MAGKITIVNNTVEPLGGPNLGLSTEQGHSWNQFVTDLNSMFTELFGGTGTVAGAKTYTGTQAFQNFTTFVVNTTAANTATFTPAGTLTATGTVVGSSATNTTQTLASYTLPANVLDAAGRSLEIMSWGRTANNAAPKTVRTLFGGAGFSSGTQTGAAYAWNMTGLVMKSTANAQNIRFTGTASGGAITMASSTDTSVDTGTIAITITCADASAAQSNIFLDGFTVRYYQ